MADHSMKGGTVINPNEVWNENWLTMTPDLIQNTIKWRENATLQEQLLRISNTEQLPYGFYDCMIHPGDCLAITVCPCYFHGRTEEYLHANNTFVGCMKFIACAPLSMFKSQKCIPNFMIFGPNQTIIRDLYSVPGFTWNDKFAVCMGWPLTWCANFYNMRAFPQEKIPVEWEEMYMQLNEVWQYIETKWVTDQTLFEEAEKKKAAKAAEKEKKMAGNTMEDLDDDSDDDEDADGESSDDDEILSMMRNSVRSGVRRMTLTMQEAPENLVKINEGGMKQSW